MAKKDKIIILILSIILIISCIAVGYITSIPDEGEEKYLILSCNNKEIKKSSSITCTLKGNRPKYKVSAFSGTIEESKDFKIEKIIPDKSFEGNGEDGDIDLYTDTNKSGKFNILSFKVTLTNENVDKIKITLKENSFFYEKFTEHKLKNTQKEIKVKK